MRRNDLRICKNSRFKETDIAYEINKMEFNLVCDKCGEIDVMTSRQTGFVSWYINKSYKFY